MNVIAFLKVSTKTQKQILFIYILSFTVATFIHSIDLIQNGIFPYITYPQWANIYWTSLTIIDPLAILLILVSLKIGSITYGIIIISDVLINMYFTLSIVGFYGLLNIFMISQLAFLIFYLFTVPSLLKLVNENKIHLKLKMRD